MTISSQPLREISGLGDGDPREQIGSDELKDGSLSLVGSRGDDDSGQRLTGIREPSVGVLPTPSRLRALVASAVNEWRAAGHASWRRPHRSWSGARRRSGSSAWERGIQLWPPTNSAVGPRILDHDAPGGVFGGAALLLAPWSGIEVHWPSPGRHWLAGKYRWVLEVESFERNGSTTSFPGRFQASRSPVIGLAPPQ
jgi:hypothetical protein